MKTLFGFGEKVPGYEVRVLNEREARAAAGLLFLAAIFAFMNVWLVGNYFFIKVFISGFLVDFSIRLFLSPRYSPSLILGRWMVQRQKVEYTGAPQKRFAWTIGFMMSLFMFYTLVIMNQATLLTCVMCVVCLFFLFFETAFGICIGCWLYNALHSKKAKYCPGGVCEVRQKESIQKVTMLQLFIVVFLALGLWAWSKSPWIQQSQSMQTGQDCATKQLFGNTHSLNNNSCATMHPL